MAYNKENTKIILYPILYWVIFIIIPCKLVAKVIDPKQELMFILIGLIVPYIILDTYFIVQVINSINNSSFPF